MHGLRGRLDGRTAVVTGAGSGIGLATVRRFAAEGAHVVVVDIDEQAGEKAAAEAGGLFVRADVTSAEDVAAMFAAAFDAYGSVDVAFNNAGISPPEDDSILSTGLEAWRRVQEVNLTSVYLCCKEVIPYMQRQGRGSIINTASFVAVMGAATSQISYTASKGGVLALSRELGVQFARQGIRVNALCPGPVNTPLLQELFAADPERAARRMVHIPMGRFGEADEIAAAVAFLASDDASFITASSFLVDGGISGAYVTPLQGAAGADQLANRAGLQYRPSGLIRSRGGDELASKPFPGKSVIFGVAAGIAVSGLAACGQPNGPGRPGSASPTPAMSSVSKTASSAVKAGADAAASDGLTGLGATMAAWNAHHRSDAGYSNITPQGGRVVEYTVTTGALSTGAAIKRARQELPSDARQLWSAQKGNCYQVELSSQTLGRALSAPATDDPTGGILAIINTLLPDGSAVYRSTDVNEIMLAPGNYPAPEDAPDC